MTKMCKLKFKWTWSVYEPKQKINANHDTWKNSFYGNVIQGCNMIADNNLKITTINIQKIQKIPLFSTSSMCSPKYLIYTCTLWLITGLNCQLSPPLTIHGGNGEERERVSLPQTHSLYATVQVKLWFVLSFTTDCQ